MTYSFRGGHPVSCQVTTCFYLCQASPVAMGGGALQVSEGPSPSVLGSRGQFKQRSNIILQKGALLHCAGPANLLSAGFTVCALSPPAGLSAANNEMFPMTTKAGRRRRKLYKTGDESPFLDSPLTVRKIINYIIKKVLASFFSNNVFGGSFSVICRGRGGERK